MFVLFTLVLLIKNEILREGISPVIAEDSCKAHYHCQPSEVCCKIYSDKYFQCQNNQYLSTVDERSCYLMPCTASSDCRGRKDGKELCCMYGHCRPCQVCHRTGGWSTYYKRCGYAQSCCFRRRSQDGVCSDSCIGEWCQWSNYCAIGECCLSDRCSDCNNLGCTDKWHCPFGHECCDVLNTHGNRSCKTSCFAYSCILDNDCVSPEYCKNNRCSLHNECKTSADCKIGSHKCCPLKSTRAAKLCSLDCNNVCANNDDCEPPNDCCYGNNCSRCLGSCRSSSDCPDGKFCCNSDKKCTYRSDCVTEACLVTSDCVKYRSYCIDGICDSFQQCNSSADCVTSDGYQQLCCIDRHPPYYCSTSCDLDLYPKQDNSNQFPNWLFGLLGGFLVLIGLVVARRCYLHRRKLRQSSENAICDAESERGQNETQVGFEHDEPNPPPYIPSNPLASPGNVDDCPNVPPPPYSFDDEIASPDRNNDPPPQYRLIQL